MAEPVRLSDRDEVEFKLSVVGEDPARTLAAIADLDRLPGVDLGPATAHRIRDLYWDTPARAFQSRRLSLRLRDLDGHLLFTVKASGGSTAGLFRRQELELPADREGLRRVRAAVRQAGVAIPLEDASEGTPRAWLERAGLIVTQDRETRRLVRHAMMDAQPVAELALDSTVYRFGARQIPYHEVEVEQLDQGDEIARSIGEALLDAFPGRLERARMGKYSRGLKLEQEIGEPPRQP